MHTIQHTSILMKMNPLEILQQATSQTEEINALDQLKKHLSPTVDGSEEEDVERHWLSLAAESLGDDGPYNPFPTCTPEGLLCSQSDLDRFTCYLFERRFSWSEANNHHSWSSQKGLGQQNATISTEQDAKLKGRLNNLLDEFLRWYICQEVSLPLLKSLQITFTQACNMPVVRNQTIIHVMEWLQLNSNQPCLHQYFTDAQSLVLCGLCDVWSAIRNSCVTRLGQIASNLTLQELESLFIELAKICLNQDSTWQCVEGALMAINLLLKSFQWIGVLPTSTFEGQVPTCMSKGQYFLKFGKEELSQLPEFISSHIHALVYPLLAHPQLAVRDNATKAFSTYLSRCDFKVALQSLREAVLRLSQDDDIKSWTADYSLLSHHAVIQTGYTFLAACEAEGLLSVCLYLIKHVQSGVLLPNWPKYFTTFSLYLMHPASTVRQAASVIFKYMVAKESNNPALLKLVLQFLCANWIIDIANNLMMCSSKFYHSTLHQETRQSSLWNDGKMTKYDTLRRQLSTEQEKQTTCSIMTLHQIKEENFQDSHFCRAWEWREGRLFAYELIVKFLIINHIHYLFPSYALLPSKFDGSVSADGAVTRSCQPVSHQRPAISKSFSHGGSSNASHGITSQYRCLARSGSERRKEILEEERSRTLAEASFFKKQFSKHYSYFTNQHTLSNRRKSSLVTATSLLCQVRDMDAALKVYDENPSYCEQLLIPSPMAIDPVHRETLPEDVKMLLHSALSASNVLGRQDSSDVDWLQRVELKKLSALLRQMLLQTISCLADGRWEVRRMAQQALPLITECIRWYDMSVLTSLWNHYLSPKESLVSYGLAMTLAVSVHHVVRLVHFMDAPPVSWKDPDICRGITLPIITTLTNGLSKWCGITLSLLRDRITVDKLTVVTLEIIITAHIYFPELLSEKNQYEMAVLKKILHVFCHAHPDHPISQQSSSDEYLTSFNTPVDGFLCCCYKAERIESPACQVERYLLTELHQYMPSFLQSCSVQGACSLLPVLLHILGHYYQDSHITKCLLEGCMIVGNKAARLMQQDEAHGKEQLVQVVPSAMEEMTALVSHKDLEMVTLKQVLDLFLIISGFVEAADQLTLMLSAISSRFDLSVKMDSENGASQSSKDEDTTNLVYLSNNIPAIPVDNGDSSDEDEDDKKHGSSHAAESLSLSVSGGSGQTPWHSYIPSQQDQHGVPVTLDSQDESDSDWDSWDDEQEDQTSLYCVVSEFIQKLQENRKHGGQSPLILAICQLNMKEQSLLNKLLAHQ